MNSSLPRFSVQIKHKICKNMNYLQQQREHHSRLQQFQPREQNKKVAKITSWLPCDVVITIYKPDEPLIHHNLLSFCLTATILNFQLNPLVYSLRMPEFRADVKRLLWKRNFHNFEENISMAN